MLKRISIIILSAFFLLILLIYSDKLLGLLKGKSIEVNSAKESIYRLPEFTIKVKLNSQGFRGEEYNRNKNKNTVRILVIGDSFSFGWGADLEDSWTNILERELNKFISGKKIEVINVSVAGNTPFDYPELARKYVPLYKPDFLIIGLVEGNDFSQLILKTNKENKTITEFAENKRREYLKLLENREYSEELNISLERFLPNIYKFISKNKVVDVRKNFKKQMKEIITDFDDEDFRIMENNNSPEIRKIFMSGGINPPLFFWTVRVSDFYIKPLKTESKEYLEAKEKLTKIIKDIKKIAFENQSQTIILDIPNGVYTSKFHLNNYRNLGFDTFDEMLTSTLPYSVSQNISNEEKIPFILNLDTLRNKCQNKCFWKYDDHLTPYGNKILTEKIIKYFRKEISNKFTK